MPRMIWLLLLILTLGNCAKITSTDPPQPPTVDYSNAIHLIGRRGFGQACPVNGKVLTAAHVVERSTPLGENQVHLYAWSNQEEAGFAKPSLVAIYRDLGTLDLETQVDYYELGSAPVLGDQVSWVEFQTGTLRPNPRRAEVINTVSGHIVFDAPPRPGASGSCLFDEEGKVIGIVIWALRDRARGTGVAVALYGEWWTYP